MFCSKCGKTIHAEDRTCPSCGAAIGNNRFGGIPYTSAQFTIAPGQTTFEPLNDYTKTTYTGMQEDSISEGDTDTRTTYRPIYEGASAPRGVRRDMRARVGIKKPQTEPDPSEGDQPAEPEEAVYERPDPDQMSEMAKESLSELYQSLQPEEDIDLSQFNARPIQAEKRTGISQDVRDYIRKLEDDQARKGRYVAESDAKDYADAPADYGEEGADSGEDYDYDDYEDEQIYDDEADVRSFGAGQIIKIAIAVLLAAALILGGIMVVKNIRKKSGTSSTIEGVTEELRTKGIALIRSHTDSEYVNTLIDMYTGDGLIAMSNRLTADSDAIDALMPAAEDAASYDETFIDALQSVQEDIATAVTMDAIAAQNVTEDAVSESESRWQSVNNEISSLEACTTPAELTAIISGPKLEITASTPAPTATPIVYASLAKGDESEAVLELQNRLYELGYLNDDRDGKFGSKTQTAVKLFQETAGIEASGIADSNTQTLLYSDEAPYAPGATTPTPAPTPEPTEEPLIQPAEANEGGEAAMGVEEGTAEAEEAADAIE